MRKSGAIAASLLTILAVFVAPAISSASTRLVAAHLRVVAFSPTNQPTGVSGTQAIRITFNRPLARATALPSLVPPVPGQWNETGRNFIFTPVGAYEPGTTVEVVVPGRAIGVRGVDGSTLRATSTTFSFKVAIGSVLRAEQLLARLGYLPLQFFPDGALARAPVAAAAAIFDPQPGHFSWRFTPSPVLRALWQPGVVDTMFTGAVMAFQAHEHLPTNGTLSLALWSDLLSAGQQLAANYDRAGYVNAVASKSDPEMLNVYDNGRVVLHTLANTGIALAPTADGTYPVYLRLAAQIMRGVNPDGVPYADPVAWVAYFNGSDAVHYFDRASYGWPQSLGCVEVPWQSAKTAYGYLQIGSLVTVTG